MELIVVGGGIAGLSTALLLAGDGHSVTVLERDTAPPPVDAQEAWTEWERRGVSQFRMLHFFAPRFRRILEEELPQVVSALDAAGALRFNAMALIPDEMKGGPRAGDEDFEAITGRRPVIEAVFGQVAAATPELTIRRGVGVEALLVGPDTGHGIPHVVGVRTEGGEELHADLVIDATGRRSPLPRWLADIGAASPYEELDDSGFVYYGRHFRSDDGSLPAMFGPLLTPCGSVSVLTLPADHGTWGIGIIAGGGDTALRGLRHVDRWMEAVRRFPLAAHWTEGEPLDEEIAVMAKIEDRLRRLVVDGKPVVTGVLTVADSWACTNPSVGRGATIGLMHAVALRDMLRKVTPGDDPTGMVLAWDDKTRADIEPWYRATLELDHHSLASAAAAVRGEVYEPDDPRWAIGQALQFGAGQDPDLLRASLSMAAMLKTPDEVLHEPGIFEKVIAVGDAWRDAPLLGPDRAELVQLASG